MPYEPKWTPPDSLPDGFDWWTAYNYLSLSRTTSASTLSLPLDPELWRKIATALNEAADDYERGPK